MYTVIPRFSYILNIIQLNLNKACCLKGRFMLFENFLYRVTRNRHLKYIWLRSLYNIWFIIIIHNMTVCCLSKSSNWWISIVKLRVPEISFQALPLCISITFSRELCIICMKFYKFKSIKKYTTLKYKKFVS